MENKLKKGAHLNDMQFGFRPGKGTTDAIVIVCQLQEKYQERKKNIGLAFIDLEKAFDRVTTPNNMMNPKKEEHS